MTYIPIDEQSCPEQSVTVYIGLGSNMSKPLEQVEKAIKSIKDMKGVKLLSVSSWYANAAIGPGQQPDYVNGVAIVTTELSPVALLDGLQNIETAQGRVRNERWGARTLDLDILIYGNGLINSQRLIVPHTEMNNRSFVIHPLCELVPGFILANGKTVSQQMQDVADHDLHKIEANTL